MKYTAVTNPVWSDANHSSINCMVDFVGSPESPVPFTANPLDEYNPASKEIYDDCVAGEHGVIGEYVDPVEEVHSFTQEQLDEQSLAAFKASRELAVSQITVTTASNKVFDGDEVSQNRMARAVASSDAGDTTIWVLADNTPATVTHEELKEALRLAGEAQTALWVQS